MEIFYEERNIFFFIISMSEDQIYNELGKICGLKNISNDSTLLKTFSEDLSFFPKNDPKYVIWPENRN